MVNSNARLPVRGSDWAGIGLPTTIWAPAAHSTRSDYGGVSHPSCHVSSYLRFLFADIYIDPIDRSIFNDNRAQGMIVCEMDDIGIPLQQIGICWTRHAVHR